MSDRQDELLSLFQDEYLPKIYGFARIKLNQYHEAEEFAGEIILQVVKYIRSGGIIDNMNAFVWKVSNNTLCKLIRQKKHGNTVYLTEFISSDENIEDDIVFKEDIAVLRRELSLMSEKYRRTVILYYFDGKTCEEIASIIGKPSGTVKWWLHEAKKFIKEGMNTMREFGEKSYKPASLSMSCQCQYGADIEPMSCAKRKSAQNILLAAYKEPLSVQELSLELGIAAPYIEDEAEYLTQQQLMKKSGDKYQTDFVILPDCTTGVIEKVYELCFPGYFNELIKLLETNKEKLISAPFNSAGFAWNRLLWVYLHLFTDINLCKFKSAVCKCVYGDNIPDRPNGGKWIAIGWGNIFPEIPAKNGWKEYFSYDGPVHKMNYERTQGFFHHWSKPDSSVFFDIPAGVFSVCRDIINGIKDPDKLNDEDKLLFSYAIEKSLFIKTDGGFKLNYCFIGKDQMEFIQSLCDGFYEKAGGYFKRAWDIITDEFEKIIPKHLHWQMGNLLSNYLNPFVTCSLYEAYNKGMLSKPDENNKAWLSLFATE